MIQNYWYKKEYAQAISGIAILLMVAHHFFGFGSWLLPGVTWLSVGKMAGIEVERIIGAFGKICVSLYAFNSGYVLWVNRSDYRHFPYRMKRLLKFLIAYWVIVLLFGLYALVVGDKNPEGIDMLLVLVGYATGANADYVNVAFAWYVTYYIFFMSLASVWLRLFSTGHKAVDGMVLALAAVVCCSFEISFLSPFMVGLWGIVAAKWHLFEMLDRRMARLPKWAFAGSIPALVILRQGVFLMAGKVNYSLGSLFMGG